MYLLFFAAFNENIRWHSASAWGDFSYGIYLYGFPIQQLVMFALDRKATPLELFALSLPPTLVAGALSWHLVEKWFLKTKPSKTVPATNE